MIVSMVNNINNNNNKHIYIIISISLEKDPFFLQIKDHLED